jgi:BirA family biotin operon repressor/biotin-[acetyl-CoA-carboxylase] ligase
VNVPDLLLPEALAPRLAGTRFAQHLHYFHEIGSTNVEAMQAAAGGAPEGSVFLAEAQTAGRGRGDHQWLSEPSLGIHVSVVLRPPLRAQDALALSLSAGLAVQAAVAQLTRLNADLRWPNDLLLNGRKFSGILTEMSTEGDQVRYAVVGIGVNANQDHFRGELAQTATSLRMVRGSRLDRRDLLAALLQSLDREYAFMLAAAQEGHLERLFARFESASSYARGKRVHVEEEGGYEGVTDGLDVRGFLRVQTASGLRTVLNGGVREIRG